MKESGCLLAVRERREGDVLVIVASGEIDLDSIKKVFHPALERALLECKLIVVDLCEVIYIDSEGIKSLILFKRKLEKAGGKLAIACLEESNTRRVIRIVHLEDALALELDVGSAVVHLQQEGN